MVTIKKLNNVVFEPKYDIEYHRRQISEVTDNINSSINKLKEIEEISNLKDDTQIKNAHIKVMDKMESLKNELRDYDNLLYEIQQKLEFYLNRKFYL